MASIYRIAIVGSGPAGLSAAALAAELGLSHILLESAARPANTVSRYQKGKHVMAEPGVLPLRACVPFSAGRREEILSTWDEAVTRLQVNLRLGAEVAAIAAADTGFRLKLA